MNNWEIPPQRGHMDLPTGIYLQTMTGRQIEERLRANDLIIVPVGIMAVVKLIPSEVMDEHRAAAAKISERPVSRSGAAVILLIWLASVTLIGWLAYRAFAKR